VTVELVTLGEPVPLDLLEGEPGLLDAERAGLLQVVDDAGRELVRLAHPLLRTGTALGDAAHPGPCGIPVLAERLARTPPSCADDVVMLATWQLAAGMVDGPVLLAEIMRWRCWPGRAWRCSPGIRRAATARAGSSSP